MWRKRENSAADDDWTLGRYTNGTVFRFKVRLDRIKFLEEPFLELLTEEAKRQGMMLDTYIDWVARMPQLELHEYRDRLMRGEGDQQLRDLYEAWLVTRDMVTEVQLLINTPTPHWI